MGPVVGACDDVQIGALLARIGDKLERGLLIVERHHQHAGLLQPSGAQDVGAGGIAEKALEPEAAHHRNGLHVVVQHHGLEAAGLHQPVHDLTEAPDARDDDRTLLVDLVVGMLLLCGRVPFRQHSRRA